MAEQLKTSEQVLNRINDLLNNEADDKEFANLTGNADPAFSAEQEPALDASSQTPPLENPDVVGTGNDKSEHNRKATKRRLAEKEERERREAENNVKPETTDENEMGNDEDEPKIKEESEQKKDPLEEAVKTARQQYARTEFRYQEKMKEIEKESKFKLARVGNKYAENPDTKNDREAYEKVLRLKMDREIAEIEARSINGQYDEKKVQAELKELYTYFNVKAAHDLYNSRTDEIIAYKKEDSPDKSTLRRGWDAVSSRMISVANWYNKEVPFWVKGGLAVGSFVAGAGAFTTGKRVWGALLMATAGGMQLDAAAQFFDKYSSNKESAKNIKEVENEDGEIDFEKFKEILEGKIDGIDKKLDKYVLRSKVNKVIAVGLAAVFGSMALSGMAHALPSGGAEHAASVGGPKLPISGVEHDVKVEGAKLPKIPTTGVFALDSAATPNGHTDTVKGIHATVANVENKPSAPLPKVSGLDHWSTNSFGQAQHLQSEDAKGWSENAFGQDQHLKTEIGKTWSSNALEHANESASTTVPATSETLTIEKGSSIERTLIDHIKKIHPDMKNPGHAAHRMWLDYMHDNKADIIKKVGDSEYHKMLKDGMVNVKPGTTLMLDEHDPLKIKLHDIGGKISHLQGHHSVGGGAVESGQPAELPNPVPTQTANIGDIAKKVAVDVASQNAVEAQQHITTGQEMFKSASAEYSQAANDAMMHPAGGDGPSMAQYDAMQHADDARKAAVATVENAAHAKELYFKSITNVANNIYKTTGYRWADIKDLDYSSAYADDKLNPVIKQTIKEFKKEFGGKNIPNYNAKFGEWIYKVQEVSIKKRLGIFAG